MRNKNEYGDIQKKKSYDCNVIEFYSMLVSYASHPQTNSKSNMPTVWK